MLKAISSALPAIHESSYTVVDVKFEAGAGGPIEQDMMSHYEPSNHNFVPENGYEEEDGELQTPNASPPTPTNENFNKRKRSIPKKFSVDEDENPISISQDLSQIVKAECVDYTQHSYEDIAAPEQGKHVSGYGTDWDDTTVDQIDINRVNAQKMNSKQRDDCPICGDKANGLHYGVYTCEGCKNFFKRSVVMTQRKPYICNNQNNCDVRIVIDMSGIKRKGARCQACRYIACLDAGMYHSGYPRSRGGRHNSRSRGGSHSHQTDWNEMIAGHQQQLALEAPLSQSKKPRIVAPSRKQSAKESNESATDYLDYENNSTWDTSAAGSDFHDYSNLDTSISHDLHSNNVSNTSDELINNSQSLFESVFRDDIEKERSKNRDLSSRLAEKDKQLKLAERQMENMRKHMMISQTVACQQQEEIKRLKNEISRLGFFQSKVRNYQCSSGMVNMNGSGGVENESDGVMIDPDMCAVSFNE
jgi:ribosomal protein L37AE/L43A